MPEPLGSEPEIPKPTIPDTTGATFAAALSQHPTSAVATGEVVGTITEQVGIGPDLAIVFVSGSYLADIVSIRDTIAEVLQPRLASPQLEFWLVAKRLSQRAVYLSGLEQPTAPSPVTSHRTWRA